MPSLHARHVIADISYSEVRKGWYGIDCSCDERITAAQDELVRDRHEPLVVAWNAHRATTPWLKETREARAVWRRGRVTKPLDNASG